LRGQCQPTTTNSFYRSGLAAKGSSIIHHPMTVTRKESRSLGRRLYSRFVPRWERYANEHFLAGIYSCASLHDRVPRLETSPVPAPADRVPGQPVSGGCAVVSVFRLPADPRFPTTINIRRVGPASITCPEPRYLPHIAGHVPMPTDRNFARRWFGSASARTLRDLAGGILDQPDRVHVLTSIFRAMAASFGSPSSSDY